MSLYSIFIFISWVSSLIKTTTEVEAATGEATGAEVGEHHEEAEADGNLIRGHPVLLSHTAPICIGLRTALLSSAPTPPECPNSTEASIWSRRQK